jgi:hypothetical protein
MVGFNVYMDEFGLYGKIGAKERRVWTYNRATKYLFSLKHIPKNFDAILIGSSSAAVAMDTRKIKNHAIYNLSLNGGNVCEVAPAAMNAMNLGKMKALIVCLDPYFTKNSIMKTNELSPMLKQSTLGSLFTIKFYLFKLKHTLFPNDDPYRNSWMGFRMPDAPIPIADEQDHPHKVTPRPITTDPAAIACLEELLTTARNRGVRVLAYFYPKPHDVYAAQTDAYQVYQKQMLTIFNTDDIIWNFNTPEFDSLTKDPTSFYDRGHLSMTGATTVLKTIEQHLSSQ